MDTVPGELIYYARHLPKELTKLYLVPISDVHFGDPRFSYHHFKRTLNFIRDTPHAYTFLNGDLLDTALPSSVGDVFSQVCTPQKQRDWMIDQLLPIKDKVLGMVTGNHENRIYKLTGIDVSMDIAKALNVPYRPEGMIVKICFGSGNSYHPSKPFVYFGHFTHGYGGARTDGAKLAKGQRQSTYTHCDFYVMSHDHLSQAEPANYLYPDQRTRTDAISGFEWGKLNERRKMIFKSSAYVKWGGYGEMGGFSPSDLTTSFITLAGSEETFELGKYPSVRATI